MTRISLCAYRACSLSAVALATALLCSAGPALAQSSNSGGFLDNLFNRGQPQQAQQQSPQAPPQQSEVAQGSGNGGGGGDVESRIDRIENALRQLTGTVEDLQHQNQILQMQLKRMQDDTEYRFQQLGARGTVPQTQAVPPAETAAPTPAPGQRSDAFNPAQHPSAPGVPHALGNPQALAVPQQPVPNQPPGAVAETPAPAGAPLDLSSLAGNAPVAPPASVPNAAPMGPAPQAAPMAPPQGRMPMTAAPQRAPQSGQLPPPPPRNTSATGAKLATLPPTSSPKDEYDLAYGYVLHKNYGLAEQAFRDFMRKYPNERLLPDAQYWLGESQFEQKRYRDAAESFLAVSTKYEHSGKAPESLLRLGQSLAAMHQKEAACATFAEVGRKYPHAAASIKHGVTREQKHAHC